MPKASGRERMATDMDQRMRNSLDRYITGNYGEDQFREEEDDPQFSLKIMEAVVKLLHTAGLKDAHLEYPGCIVIHGRTYGTANEDWGWDNDQGSYGSLEVSSKSEDAAEIADAILAHEAECRKKLSPQE
jgi:hypothetical protein